MWIVKRLYAHMTSRDGSEYEGIGPGDDDAPASLPFRTIPPAPSISNEDSRRKRRL